MSIFIDTGIFIGYVNKDDAHHAAAYGLIEDIIDNKMVQHLFRMWFLMKL